MQTFFRYKPKVEKKVEEKVETKVEEKVEEEVEEKIEEKVVEKIEEKIEEVTEETIPEEPIKPAPEAIESLVDGEKLVLRITVMKESSAANIDLDISD